MLARIQSRSRPRIFAASMRVSRTATRSAHLTIALAMAPTSHLATTAFSLQMPQVGGAAPRHSSQLAAAGTFEPPFPTWSFDEPCGTMLWTDVSEASLAATDDVASLDADADLVLIGVFAPKKDDSEEDKENDEDAEPTVALTGEAKAVDEKLGGALTQLLKENHKEFKLGAKAGSITPVIRTFKDGKMMRYAVVGLGPAEADDGLLGVGSATGATLAKVCNREKKVVSAKMLLPAGAAETEFLRDASASFYTGLYSDNRFRTGDKVKKLAEDLSNFAFVAEAGLPDGADSALDDGKKLSLGTHMTKDIVNAPHNVLNSVSLADTAKRIAEESGGTLKCEVLDKKACEERGMGAYLGVARASETEPQFIHITYTPPEGPVNKKVGVIGKGLLFDTGGYNIKTGMMELMKFDCGGAAAVLGAARAVGALKPPGVEAHFVVAACENMINDKGVVPSDILTASNGKTIEVLNTDAEGRLTLADALVFCDKEIGCESIIELSTLTGACMVALGKNVCGMWTDDDDLAESLASISKATEEKAWRMPLEKSYNKDLESKIADIKNIGTRYGGAITAALFLQNFVDKKKPFAHIDIAGPVWNDGIGATGFGAKLVTEWVTREGK